MKNKGFALIEVMVVVVTISILAVLAFPVYQNYVIRSQTTRALAELTNMRNHMEACNNRGMTDFGEEKGECPLFPLESSIMFESPEMTLGGESNITATLGGQAIPALHGSIMKLQRNHDGVWKCYFTTDLSPNVFPKGCIEE